MGVAETPVAARGDDNALAWVREVGEHRAALLVEHLRSDRRLQHRIGSPSPCTVLAHAVHPSFGLEVLLVAKVDESVEAIRAFDHNVASAPAVAAVGAAELDEFLAPERDAARPAVARADVDARLIEKLHASRPVSIGAASNADRNGSIVSAQASRERV